MSSSTGRVVRVVIISLLIAGFIRLFVFASYRMPSEQMESAVLAGDFIGVNQLAYGIKYPVFSGNALSSCFYCNRTARRNDVFLYKSDGQVLIGRCAGIPGDTIESKGFDYLINGRRFAKNPNTVLPYQYNLQHDSLISATMRRLSLIRRDSVVDDSRVIRYFNRYEQYSLADALPDSVVLLAYEKEQRDYRIVIPEEQYWVLCDNIDASADSRHYGFVAHKDLIGRASFIWFSKDPSQSVLKGYRFKRFFKSVV